MIFEIVGAAANVAKNYTLDSGALSWSRPAAGTVAGPKNNPIDW